MDKRNALDNRLRGELFEALQRADADAEVRRTVLRGAGTCFSAGHDLGSDTRKQQPCFTAPGDSQRTA